MMAAMLVAMLVVPLARPADAQLARVARKKDPAGGYPLWFEDTAGLRLQLCANLDDPLCSGEGLAAETPDPDAPLSVKDGNFPEESFYWSAEAAMDAEVDGAADPARGSSALLVLALEAAWVEDTVGGEEVALIEPGKQVVFSRIRLRLDNFQPNTQYSIVHPFGTAVLLTDEEGEAREAGDLVGEDPAGIHGDIGCEPGAGAEAEPVEKEDAEAGAKKAKAGDKKAKARAGAGGQATCDFALATQGGIGPFLVWDTFPGLGAEAAAGDAPPVGYVGDPLVEHAVAGSPFNTNFFEVSGSGLAEPASTDQFSVMGKILGASRPALAPESDTGAAADDLVTNANSVTFTGVGPPGTMVKALVDGKGAGKAEVDGGLYSVTIDDLAEGTHEISAAANDDSAPSSPLTVTVDRTAPGISAIGMEPATFDTAEQKSATLTARISEEAAVTAEVVDADGTVVRELPTEQGASGTVTATWDGKTDSSAPAESGTYEIVLAATDMAGNVSSEGTGVELAAATIPDSGDGGSTVIWIIVGAALALAVVVIAVRTVRRRGAEPQEL
jgi:hypothetical protein